MDPIVSIRVITYNHERYLAQCLEGILMQRTTFPFEVIVGEDCSTDGTRAIATAYAQRYPDRLRLITSETNVGGWANALRVRAACRGRYHALCEGDDCWIDPLKLQKQVDFLEAHPASPLCFHDALIIWEGKTSWPRYYCPNDLAELITLEEVITRPCFIPTASIVLRASLYQTLPQWEREVWCSDLTLRLWSAQLGPLGYLNEIMSLWRRVPTGMTNTTSVQRSFEDTRYVLTAFDALTEHRYRAHIARRIRAIEIEYRETLRSQRLGRWYLLLSPRKLVRKMQEYYANMRW